MDTARVLAGAARLVDRARRLAPDYAGRYAPVRTDQLLDLLERAGCHVEVFPFESDCVAMALPRTVGVYPVLLNRDADRVDRTFAMRHELAHVLAGDVDEVSFLSDGGPMAHPERVADLFALADLLPGWGLRHILAGCSTATDALGVVEAEVAFFARGWPADRLHDRARLRLRLFDLRGI